MRKIQTFIDSLDPEKIKMGLGICAIAILAVLLIIYLRKNSLEKIRKDIYSLFQKAEDVFIESGEGPKRMEWVVNSVYNLLPKYVTAFMTKSMLKVILQKWFTNVKDLIDDGEKNNSAVCKAFETQDSKY